MHGAVSFGMLEKALPKKIELIFLHGFLGSPLDWEKTISYLPAHYSCRVPDLADGTQINFSPLSVLIGYSMGGRIALQMPPACGLVLIGAHFGLTNEPERRKRREEEERLCIHLKRDPIDFIDWWYRQPLFSTLPLNDELRKRRESIDFTQHAQLFEWFALSKQPLFIPPPSALLLYGENDKKYANLYSAWPNAHAIPDAGHAAHLENPKMTAQFIQHYVEGIYAQNGSG